MKVACIFISAGGGNTDKDAELVSSQFTHLGLADAEFSTDYFASVIKKRVDASGSITLDRDEMIVVGGRKSIAEAFGELPVSRYIFAAGTGKILCLTHSRCSPDRNRAIGLGIGRVGQIAVAPAYQAVAALVNGNDAAGFAAHMGSTLSPAANSRVFTTLGLATKTRTVLHIFSAPSSFDGHQLARRHSGAQISLLVRRYFS